MKAPRTHARGRLTRTGRKDCGPRPWPSWGRSTLTGRSSTGLPGFWSHWGRVARLMRGKMTWRKVVIRILKISFKFNLSGTQLLEVYTLEIQMYTAQKYNKKLKALYDQVVATFFLFYFQLFHFRVFTSSQPFPTLSSWAWSGSAGARCTWGRGSSRRLELSSYWDWSNGFLIQAHTDFFEAFKNYDESGSPRRTTCLKYLGGSFTIYKHLSNFIFIKFLQTC